MKKVLLTLVLAFAGILAANAQVWIGGSTSATINKDVTSFTIVPEVGYCIPNTKWTVALGADYAFNKLDGFDATHGLLLSPYVRYSICNIEKFALFMDLTGDFGIKGYDGYRVGLQPGIAWMATEHWTAAFRFAFIGYNHCDYYGAEGFRMNFATAAPGFGLYYNF